MTLAIARKLLLLGRDVVVARGFSSQTSVASYQEIAQEAIANRSFIAVMADQDKMFELMNSIAPEHLELQVQDPITAMGKVQNAGRMLTVCTGEVRAYTGDGPDYKVVALMQATMVNVPAGA